MEPSSDAKCRIIVALDVPTIAEAHAIITELHEHVGAFKVGLELLTSAGVPAVIDLVKQHDTRLFFDGKFCDIPNTTAGAARAVAKHGVWMFNVHASAGIEAMTTAVANKGHALIVAVTVLTSLTDANCSEIYSSTCATKVLQLASMAAACKVDGIICSPLELPLLQNDPALRNLITVVPGIRPAWAAPQDQARITTPREAILQGASYLVVGRPLVNPPHQIGTRVAAAHLIATEVHQALELRTQAPEKP